MSKILNLLSGRVFLWALLAGVVSLSVGIFWLRYSVYREFQNDQMQQTIIIQEKRHEIANNRPDRSGVVKRLREGTF